MKSMWVAIGIIAFLAGANFLPMASLKTPRMTEYSSHGITVYAVPEDEPEVEGIAARIDLSRNRVITALQTDESEGIGIIIYPDRAALKRKTLGFAGHFLPDWFIGRNTRDYVLITSPAAPGPEHTRESVIRAAVHEYVHVLTDRRNPRLGYWLKEGIALYLADQMPEVQSIRAARDITFAEFSFPNAIQFANVGGYTLAYTLIAYLEETYGWERVIALTAPGATYESVLGKDAWGVFEEWTIRLSLL